MKILVVADSHGYGLAAGLRSEDASVEVKVVSVGSVMKDVWSEYLTQKDTLQEFGPDHVFMHVGHNDLQWHPRHNRAPKHPSLVLSLIMGYELRLREDFPGRRVWISNPFPRAVSPHMTFLEKTSYNKTIFELGRVMRAEFPDRGIDFRLNTGLWFRPSEGREHPIYLQPDGIHLSKMGCAKVAAGWLKPIVDEPHLGIRESTRVFCSRSAD
jgi:lysophospholipase L1-like esterase